MILRLVYSFFFFSLVTGNQRLEDLRRTGRSDDCQKTICTCQDPQYLDNDQPYSPPLKITEIPLRVVKGHYGYPAHGVISANPVHTQARTETKSYGMEYVSEDNPAHQVPQPVQYVKDETEYQEKTICFTPSMVHKMIKAALEYVSQMPSDINNIIDKLDQELNRMSDQETIEEIAVKKPLYPLDSKTVFQMLDKPRSEKRTNVILKYELPSVKEPHCREALEKLIEIAYTAYMELEKHPQCRDYLYNFASHQPEDRPAGHLDHGPDLKSLVASILDQVDKRLPIADISPDNDRYGEIPVSSGLATPQSHVEYDNSQIHEYNIHKKPIIHEYNIVHKNNAPEIPDYNEPQIHEYNIHKLSGPEIHDYNGPTVKEYTIHKYGTPEIPELNGPQVPEYNIHKYTTHEIQDHNGAQLPEYNIHKYSTHEIQDHNLPQHPELNIHKYSTHEIQDHNGPQHPELNIHKYRTPEIPEPNGPQLPEYNIHKYRTPEVQDYNGPQLPEHTIHQYGVPNGPEYNLPKVTEFNVPKIHEYIKSDYNQPEVHEYNINVPKVQEYTITQAHDYNVPQIKEYTITQSHEIKAPKVLEYTVTQSHESYNVPQIQDIINPQYKTVEFPETIHETVEETIPIKPEDTITVLIKLLQNPDSGNLFDRLQNILEGNQNNFQPRIFKILLSLLDAQKKNKIPRFNDIFLLLLDSQRNRDWPWSERVTEQLLSYLIPDHNGHLNSRIVDIILNLYKTRANDKHVEYILSLLRPLKEGNSDHRIGDLILKLIGLHQNDLMSPEYVDTLLKLLKPAQNGVTNPKDVDVSDNLSRWNELDISPKKLNGIFALLKPYANGHKDHRPVDVIHYLLNEGKVLNPKHSDFIVSFLYPENGIIDTRRLDIIHFVLNNLQRYPKHANILLSLLQDDEAGVLNSRFLEILLFLDSNGLLTPELVETLINLLVNEVTGKLDDNQVKSLFFQLAPYKQSNPKLVVDVLTLLNQGGLHGNIVEWLESTNNNVGIPTRDASPSSLKVIRGETIAGRKPDHTEYRTPDGGYTTVDEGQHLPDHDFMSIFKWLESQGLLTQDPGSNTDLVNKVLNILEVGQRELGVVELTYMLKHEKPLIYQPVYYVKYRLPILSFISNMKSLLLENPNLNTDPMKLLQELIIISNVTEVSPNLQGYPKEEILKLTFNDGDLVQAKILDEQNLSLNDQIKFVHNLNSDISPEEILQLNRMNEAKYFPNLVEVKGVHPDKLTIKEVDRYLDVPPVHYRHIELKPAVAHQTKTIHHQTYIARANQKQDALHHNSALPRPQN